MHLSFFSAHRTSVALSLFAGLASAAMPLHAQDTTERIDSTYYHTPYVRYATNLQPASTTALVSVPPLLQSLPAQLQSEIAYVQDIASATTLYQKNSDEVRPIASITKLMTALIIVEAGQSMQDMLEITSDDIDTVKNTTSRLSVGSKLSRSDMLHLALMSSENRAAHALGRHYPGGLEAFVRAMNDKARALGMRKSHFIEPTGLSSSNVSTPRDLVALMQATAKHPLIHQYSTSEKHIVEPKPGRQLVFGNTNRLVQNENWDIQVSKTGFINEAGQCLVLLTKFEGREIAIVLLNAQGRYSRVADAIRLRHLVEGSNRLAML